MATLYVEGVPDDLYEALRARARGNRRSIAAEVMALLEEHLPTEADLKVRRTLMQRLARIRRSRLKNTDADYPSTEQMQREDRAR